MKSVFVCQKCRGAIHSALNEGEKQIMELTVLCPECEAEVVLRDAMEGEIIFCPDCNAELEVLNLEQPALGLAPQVEEDWGE
jgi:alpha-aminoadipate carrier protein LysW